MYIMSRVYDCCVIIDWRMQLVNPECQIPEIKMLQVKPDPSLLPRLEGLAH